MHETKVKPFINSLGRSDDIVMPSTKTISSDFIEKHHGHSFEDKPLQQIKDSISQNEHDLQKRHLNATLEELVNNEILIKRRSPDKKSKENDFSESNSECRQIAKVLKFSAYLREEEEKKYLGKQISKIKYFWRGTNMNYPFAFQRIRLNYGRKKNELNLESNSEKNEECSFIDDEGEDGIIFQEDLGNKQINPAEKFFK